MSEATNGSVPHRAAACHPVSGRAPAPAGRSLQPVEVAFLLSGNRLQVQLPDGGTAQLAFGVAGDVRAVFPDGSEDRGTWHVDGDDRYCIRWVAGPALSCTRVSRGVDGLDLADSSGRHRGRITAILPGL